MSFLTLIFTVLFSFSLTPIDLSNDQQGLSCLNDSKNLSINETDRFITYNGLTYESYEFLDKAILARTIVSTEEGRKTTWVLFHLINQANEAVVVSGDMIDFGEFRCEDLVASKTCTINNLITMTYTPTNILIDYQNQSLNIPLQHNPVYQNDGTGLIYYNDKSAAAIVDYGSNFQLIFGEAERFSCRYAD